MYVLQRMILSIPGLIIGLVFHEYAHAYVADRLGDPTPRFSGRLTLEPTAHLDFMGTILLFAYGFGWAKPVPVNPYNLRNPKRDMLWVAAAGPIANILMAILSGVIMRLLVALGFSSGFLYYLPVIARASMNINIGLAAFNLLPIAPLDGSKVLAGFLPSRSAYAYENLMTYGPIILMVLLLTGVGLVLMRPLVSGVGLVVSIAVSALTWYL